MPIYEYRCKECREDFEQLVLPSSDAPPRCPSCGSGEAERVMSLSSVSSSQTRRRSRTDGRRRGAETRREKDHEEHKRIHRHTH